MKTKRFCPWCGRPLCKSTEKHFYFQCYNCDKDFTKAEVLRKADMAQVKKLRNRSILGDLWRGEYPHSHKRSYPRKKKNYQRNNSTNNKYTISSLIALNGSYHYEHEVMQSDVDMANSYVNRIESTRSDKQPRNGDIIRLTTRDGDYYPQAHLEKLCRDGFSVCERPYIPFVYPSPTKNGIVCDTSGGAWLSIPPKALKYTGKEEKYFKDWGWRGARGNGSVCFKAEVSVWEYTAPDPLFGHYSTKDWRRVYLMKNENDKEDGYLYYGGGLAFQDRQQLDEYIRLFNGRLYPGYQPERYVLWCYFEEKRILSEKDWHALELPETTFRTKNNHRDNHPVKTGVNDALHLVTLYSICK